MLRKRAQQGRQQSSRMRVARCRTTPTCFLLGLPKLCKTQPPAVPTLGDTAPPPGSPLSPGAVRVQDPDPAKGHFLAGTQPPTWDIKVSQAEDKPNPTETPQTLTNWSHTHGMGKHQGLCCEGDPEWGP